MTDAESQSGFKAIQVMEATLSADHRVVDGAYVIFPALVWVVLNLFFCSVGAKWIASFKGFLENPLTMLL